MGSAWIVGLIAGAAVALGASPAATATLTVNTTVDETIQDGACSLREAIQTVNRQGNGDCASAPPGPDTIVLGPHTYRLQGGIGFGALFIGGVTISGAGPTRTTIDASGSGDRVFDLIGGVSATIRGLTMTGGHAASGVPGGGATAPGEVGNGGGDAFGGGAIMNGGSLTLIDVAITNSFAGDGGRGGLTWNSSPPSFAATNGAPGGEGGAGGAILNTGELTLIDSTLTGNHAGNGGAGGDVTGAGIDARYPPNGGTGGNGGDGGAIYSSSSKVTIIDSTLMGNFAGSGGAGGEGRSPGTSGGNGGNGGDGGAVWDYTGVSVTSSTFAGNGAGAGGDGSTTYFLRGAGSGGSGGGVFVDVGSAKLLNATLAGNSAGARGTGIGGYAPGVDGSGGGVAAAFTALTVQNSLLAANKPTNCASGTATDAGHNISFAGGGCPASFGPGDPKLGPLQDNGGPTLTMALGRGSAAIDQIPTFGASCPLRDQRGVRRSGGRDCDIGAYEVAAPRVERVAAQATGARTVRILVTVAANARQAAIWVRYGRTKRYGSRSAAHELRGVGPTTVSFVLRGLDLRRTYHYRIIASSPDGRSRTVDIGLAVPVLSGLVIRRAGGGATLSYTDSRAGVTVVDVQRRVRGRWVAVGTFSHRDQVGRDSVRLGRRLGRGRYRIEARPRTGRTRGVTRTVRFTIVA